MANKPHGEVKPCGNCGKNRWKTVSKKEGVFECRHCGRERNKFNKSI